MKKPTIPEMTLFELLGLIATTAAAVTVVATVGAYFGLLPAAIVGLVFALFGTGWALSTGADARRLERAPKQAPRFRSVSSDEE